MKMVSNINRKFNMKLVLHESRQLNRQLLISKIRLVLWFSGILVFGYMLITGLHALNAISNTAPKIADVLVKLGFGLVLVAILLSFLIYFISNKQLATHTFVCDNQHLFYLKNKQNHLKIPVVNIKKLCFGQVRQTASGGETQISLVSEALSIYYVQDNKKHTHHINTSMVANKAEIKQFVNDVNNKKPKAIY